MLQLSDAMQIEYANIMLAYSNYRAMHVVQSAVLLS